MLVGATCVLQSASVSVHLCNPSLSCTRSMAPTLPPLPSTKHLPPSQIDCENREVRLVGKGLLPPPSLSGSKLTSNVSSLSKGPQKIQNEFSEISSARTRCQAWNIWGAEVSNLIWKSGAGGTFEKNEMRIARARMNYVNNSMRILSNNFVDFTEYETFTF